MASASPEAPLLDRAGKASEQVSLGADVFGSEVKPHLIHETVRAELNAHRAGTRGAKSRGMVSGGRAKPWRQKGTGRARAGTIRAPHFTGGGVAFPPQMRSFEVKVNRKARRAALSSVLSYHVAGGTFGLIDGGAFETPSTKDAVSLVASWGAEFPLLVVANEDEQALIRSFRNVQRVLIVAPAQLEVASAVWARTLLVSQAALPLVEARAGAKRGDAE